MQSINMLYYISSFSADILHNKQWSKTSKIKPDSTGL